MKTSHRWTIAKASIEWIKNCRYLTFYAVTKRTTNRQRTKNQLKLGRKSFRNLKAIPSEYVPLPIMCYVTSHK